MASGADAGEAASACAVVDDDTVALYSFDDAGDISHDLAGTHDGELPNGAPNVVDGPCGSAVEFPDSLYVRVDDSPDWDLNVGSIELWLRGVDDSSDRGIISRDASGTGLPGHFELILDHDERVLARLQVQGATHFLCSEPITVDAWTHIGVNFGAPGFELFVGGELATYDGTAGYDSKTIQCGSTASDGIEGNDNPWVFGASIAESSEPSGIPVNRYLAGGAIDNVRISRVRRDFAAL